MLCARWGPRNHGPGGQDNLLAIGAVVALGDHHGDDRVADLQAGCQTGADFIDNTRGIHPRHIGRGIGLLVFSAGSVPRKNVGRVYRGGMDANTTCSRASMDVRKIDNPQGLGTSVNNWSNHSIRQTFR